MRNSRRPTSKPKADTMKKASLKDTKPQKPAIALRNELKPRTRNQAEYIRTVAENSVNIVIGPAGAGKTMIAVGLACQALQGGYVNEIILSRPIVGCGTGIAALPGNVNEKIHPYMLPLLDYLDYFLGKDQARTLLQSNVIKMIPVELMRGMSIKDTYLILDEASNANLSQLKMTLGRIDIGSKFLLLGDYKQTDIKGCDFRNLVDKLSNPPIEDVGFVELTHDDIQRKSVVSRIITRLED